MKLDPYTIDGLRESPREDIAPLISSLEYFCANDTFVQGELSYWLDSFEVVASGIARCQIRLAYDKEYVSRVKERQIAQKLDSTVESRHLVVDFQKGILLSESTYFVKTGPLTKVTYVEAMSDLFRTIGQRAAAPIDGLSRLEVTVTKEQVRGLFFEMEPLYVRVIHLAGRTFPEDFDAYNPNRERNAELRRIIAENTLDGIVDEAELRTGTNQHNLRQSPLAKALVASGQPQELVYRDPSQPESPPRRARVRNRRKITVDTGGGALALDGEAVLEAIDRVETELRAAGTEPANDYTIRVERNLFSD